ncbi:methionine--tRNA ligase [Streptomyces sp. AJS327]|uniref:class I tRNA ligase family protein n=1 Tax=Streptomyces sp. AJS327 TaxID=2545265 RepID=UPI0015E029E0|nr:class I tRNA ligase family protein [Streptomyces sp. AJS327]MBA0053164.1 methionine--tRNA ligase [Streptomyces sp. AJS327]
MNTPLWITATPPVPDGELHAGHLTGPYVAADVLSRFLRADGRTVLFTSGTADHSTSVAERALRTGRDAAQVAEGFRESITSDWLRAGVRFDRIVAPRARGGYDRWLRGLLERLHGEGVLVPRTRRLPYCDGCERWLFGARVRGGCPYCGARSAGGACRACARPNDCGDLLAPECGHCGATARIRRCRRLYLPLEPFREALIDYWRASALPPRLTALCQLLADEGLPDVAVAHPGDWGVTLDMEGFAEHRVDTCFESAAMHLYGYGYDRVPLPERTVHFCGFGHSFCHAVLLPAILITQGVKLPQEFFVNETLRSGSDGGQGRDWRDAWALDLLTEYGSDTLRRHSLEARPTGPGAVFSRERLEQTRGVLHGTWNGWLTGLFGRLTSRCGGIVPNVPPGGAGWDTQLRRLRHTCEELREAYTPEGFDPRRAVALLDEVVCSIADFGNLNAPRSESGEGGEEHLTALAAELGVCSALTAWAYPVMPEGAQRLAAVLGIEPGRPVTAEAIAVPAPGTRVTPPSGPVFGF